MKHVKWLILTFLVLSLVAIIALVIHYNVTPDDAVPTGIEIDVDRAKPRPPLKTKPKKAAPAPRSKR